MSTGTAFVPLRIVSAFGGAGAPVQAMVAKRFWLRMAGLLALPRLQSGEALLLSPCASVHTCFMRYAIDVVFVDRAGRVVKVVPNLQPWHAAGAWGAAHALELAAGQAQALDLAPGAHVDVEGGGS
jgi:uncharacterized membrane protein (UPF0127 family)